MSSESSYTLNNVRTLTNYGLYVLGNTYDPIFTKGIVQSTPNMLINGSTCTIDYSHVFDISDRIYFKKTFGTFSSGETFSVSSVQYFDEKNNVNTTIGGTCRISSTTNDNQIILATIVSGFTGVSGYNYYNRDNFVSAPQYTFTTTTGTGGYFVVNSMPNTSLITFKEMGILGSAFGFEEYIEISGGTGNNYGKIKVYGTTTLKDGTELLYYDTGITGQNQDFSTSSTSVRLYLRGYPSLITSPYNSNVTGILTFSNRVTGELLYCFDNQSINQASLRKAKAGSTYVGSYIACDSCFDFIYGSGIGTAVDVALPAYDNLIFLVVSNNATAAALEALRGTVYINQGTGQITISSITTTKTLKIDLSHPSLNGYNLSMYYDAAYKIAVGNEYYQAGVLGYNGSYGLLRNYSSPTTMYCVLSGNSTIYFKINL